MRLRLTGEKPLAKFPYPLGLGQRGKLTVMGRPTGTTVEGEGNLSIYHLHQVTGLGQLWSEDWLYSIRECLPYYSMESVARPQSAPVHSKWIG